MSNDNQSRPQGAGERRGRRLIQDLPPYHESQYNVQGMAPSQSTYRSNPAGSHPHPACFFRVALSATETVGYAPLPQPSAGPYPSERGLYEVHPGPPQGRTASLTPPSRAATFNPPLEHWHLSDPILNPLANDPLPFTGEFLTYDPPVYDGIRNNPDHTSVRGRDNRLPGDQDQLQGIRRSDDSANRGDGVNPATYAQSPRNPVPSPTPQPYTGRSHGHHNQAMSIPMPIAPGHPDPTVHQYLYKPNHRALDRASYPSPRRPVPAPARIPPPSIKASSLSREAGRPRKGKSGRDHSTGSSSDSESCDGYYGREHRYRRK